MRPLILLFRIALILVWSLWFGGMMALLFFVTRLFNQSHDTGVIGAPVLFRSFADAQIIVGAVAVVLAACVFATRRRSRIAIATLILLVIAFGMSFPIRSWTNQIETLRAANQSQSPEFKSLHGKSGIGYVASASALLVAGFLISLPHSGQRSGDARTS